MSDTWGAALAAGLPETWIGNLIERRIPSCRNSTRPMSDLSAVAASASDRRRALHCAAVAKIEVMSCDQAPRCLIRDRDCVYGHAFVRRVRAMGIRDRPAAARSPGQNGYAETLIGSIRREYIACSVVFGEAHLHRILRAYAAYYNRWRRTPRSPEPFRHRANHRGAAPRRTASSVCSDLIFGNDRASSKIARLSCVLEF